VSDAPLRLAFIAPGLSIHTKRWLENFAARGHEVGLVAYGRLGQPVAGARLLLELPVFSHAGRGLRRPVDLARAVPPVRRALRAFDPDLVHAHFLTGPGWLGALGGRAPLVVTAWGSDVFVDAKRPVVRRLHRLTLRRAALATTESRALEAELGRLGMPAERIHRVLWGIDVDRFRPGIPVPGLRDELRLPEGVPALLAMRGVREVQNPLTVIRALALLRSRGVQTVLLLLLGPGGFDALPDPLAREIERLDLRDGVRVLPEVSQERLADLYRLSTVCVSVPSTDSTSIAVLEAMASARPIVASDIPANREWVADGVEGLLVPPGDDAALAAALERLLADPVQAEVMGAAARERVSAEADERVQVDRMERLYRSLVVTPADRGSAAPTARG